MREAGIGRVLVASLHQSIADLVPMRLSFYESWLSAEGLRGGTIGVAPLNAVLSFLRREGGAYEAVASRAGELAAEWTVGSMPRAQRALIRAAPAWIRARLLLGVGRRLVRDSCRGSRAVTHLQKRIVNIDIRRSIFCTVREPVGHPLCGFYAAAITKLLALFDVPARTEIVACRGTGKPVCALKVELLDARPGGAV